MNVASVMQLCQDDEILCPHCKKSLLYGNKKVLLLDIKNFFAKIRCLSCLRVFNLTLPKLSKPIIFLDQWFLSNLFENDHSERAEAIVDKIERLKFLQRVVVVASDTDASETTQIPEDRMQKRDSIWSKVVDLSESNIFFREDLLQHQIKCKMGLVSGLPSSIEEAKSQWIIGFGGNGLRLLMQRKWMLDSRLQHSSLDLDSLYKHILENQVEKLSKYPEKTFDSAVKILKNLYISDFKDAASKIKILQSRGQLGETAESSLEYCKFTEDANKLTNGYYYILQSVLYARQAFTVEYLLKVLESIINQDICEIAPFIEIEILLSAERMLHYYENRYKRPELPERKFKVAYGKSRVNDICRVATALPYAAILLVDKDMERILKDSNMQCIREKYSQCQIFSLSSLGHFEQWLDDLLSSQEIDDELRVARRLMCGLSPLDDQEETQKMVQEIMRQFKMKN